MMATESYKRCDVTGQRKGVKEYNILIIEVAETEVDNRSVLSVQKDLSPKIVARLQAAIERVLTKPGAVKGKVLVEDK